MQTPFSTIGIGTETSYEGRLVQEKIFKIRAGGFGKDKNRVCIFPKIVYCINHKLNLNEDSPNHDIYLKALDCMTKSIYPDLLFVEEQDIKDRTVTIPMG